MEALQERIKQENIDIVLIDINLGKLSDSDGLKVAYDLKEAAPEVKIVMLTGYDLPVYKYEARKMGLSGFLNKNISPKKLFDSLLLVNQGHTCFPSEQGEWVVEVLTSMEKNILYLISSGKKRKEIASQLYISERTLSNHLQHIYEKLGVTSSIEAVTKALQMGYISPIY